MVSLTAVEAKLQDSLSRTEDHAVVAIPDEKKGEQLVLITTAEKLDRKQLADGLKTAGATELMIPRNILHVKELPVLGSGKTDYVTLNRLAQEQIKE